MKFEHRSTFDLGALRDFFSQITFLKSVHSKVKYEAGIGFVVKIFTKSCDLVILDQILPQMKN